MSLIFELREVCLSFQMILSLASAVVVRQILDSTSGLEPRFHCGDCSQILKTANFVQFFAVDPDVNADDIFVHFHLSFYTYAF